VASTPHAVRATLVRRHADKTCHAGEAVDLDEERGLLGILLGVWVLFEKSDDGLMVATPARIGLLYVERLRDEATPTRVRWMTVFLFYPIISPITLPICMNI